MKKEYDFSKAKKINPKKVDTSATMVSIRLESQLVSLLRDEADRLGIPYQTLIKSVLHRFTTGELVDRKFIA